MTTSTTHDRGSTTAKAVAAGGLTIFAAVMLFISGSMDFCRGLMAALEDKVFLNTPDYVFEFDLTTWGWIHMLFGAVAVIVSLGLLVAMKWARVMGVIIAALMVIANFLSIPYYPLWSLTLIALDGFVIWGLCVVKKETLY
ncbi:hypothetical protein OG302_03290 [Streptomyces sp. NBC_01283]|uniref:DUF7144 family membrane protein n=1 Tax=Streptomyces sp. NBC_01283 TaxID=2903812 RepID=UPI00352C8122|nr:hypothetical protein OG302_03290 [Streptomyces sp. NBC_01283]